VWVYVLTVVLEDELDLHESEVVVVSVSGLVVHRELVVVTAESRV
jgi:hypothetical protein